MATPAHPLTRLLVVEDDPGDYRLVEIYACQAGIADADKSNLLRALTLDEGVAMARRHRPDVVLLDIDLPDSRGNETLETVIASLPDIPIVVMTGHDDLDLANTALEMGVQDYLVKGQFDHQALGRSVRHALVRARLETRLRQGEQRLELALAASGLGLWDWLLTTDETFFSTRTKLMFGYDEDDDWSSVSTWERLIHPEDQPRRKAALDAHLSGDTPDYQVEYRMRHKDGHWVWVFSRGKVVSRDDAGQPLRAAGTVLDITQKKRLKLEGTELLRRIEALIRAAGDPPGAGMDSDHAAGDAADTLQSLSARQREVLHLVATGCTSSEIAVRLGISPATAVTHRRDLMRKLDLHSVAELTRYAIQHQVIGG